MRRLIDAFETGFNRLITVLAASVAVSIGLFAVLIALNWLLVRLEWGNLSWLYEAVEYTLYVGVFIAAPWVLQLGAHVRVDVLSSALPKGVATRLEQAMDVAGALLSLGLCFYGVRATISEFRDATLPDKDLRIEMWYFMLVFAVSFLLLAIEFVLRFRRARIIVETSEGAATGTGL